MEDGIDHESKFRFYSKRNMVEFPQTDCNFIVFLNSMYSRLKGKIVIRILFVALVIYSNLMVIDQILILKEKIPLAVMQASAESIKEVLMSINQGLLITLIAMILNLMFFFSRVAKYLILKKINKKMEFFNQTFVIELIMFIFGILMFQWSWNLRNIMSCVIADTCV